MAFPNAPKSSEYHKILLQYMDPNKRVSLVTKCPSLKAPDSEVPQRIHCINLEPAGIEINNTSYRLGVVLQYRQDAFVPEWHEECNKGGGMHWEVDKFGFEVPIKEETPGVFRSMLYSPKTEEEIRSYCKEKLKERREVCEKRWQKKEGMESIMQMRKERGIENPPGRMEELENLNYAIVEVEAEILRYQSRLDNNDKDIPFTAYLQLTIATKSSDVWETQTIERMKYTGNLGSAMKYLIEKLLKKPMNYVKILGIAPCGYGDCFWLPTEMKLTARHLFIARFYEKVMSTLGEFFRRINSRPFQTIIHASIHADYIGGNYEEPCTIKEVDPSFQISTMTFSRLHFDFCPNYAILNPLIDHWVRNGAPIGTYFTAYTTTGQGCIWYNSMRQREGHTIAETPTRGVQCLPNCVILPLPKNALVEFYITPIVNRPFKLLLNFEIQPRK